MKSRISLCFVVTILLISSLAAAKTISFKLDKGEPVPFDHDFHLAKYNKNCRTCHNAIFNLNQRKHFTMAEMEKGKSCGACHNGIKAFSVSDEKKCGGCHKGKPRNVAYKVKGASDVTFSHTAHLAKTGGKCRSCHNGKVVTGQKAVTMAQMEKGKSCGACHDNKQAFTVAGNCDKCHKGFKTRTVTFKTDAGDAAFSHDFHLGMYKCADCHTKIFPYKAGALKATMADMEKGKSCGACHNGNDAASVSDDCAKCHKM